jgi:hypothetical protein
MRSKGIRINDAASWGDGEILGVTPSDILEFINYGDQLHWAILELEATGDLGEKKWEQLEHYKTSQQGTQISWDDLYATCKKFEQVIWITIIGSKNEKNLRFYNSDLEMYESCEIVIELIDSSYCEVFSHDHALIDRLEKHFKDTEILAPDEREI